MWQFLFGFFPIEHHEDVKNGAQSAKLVEKDRVIISIFGSAAATVILNIGKTETSWNGDKSSTKRA